MDALKLESVSKSFGDLHAVDSVSMTVPEGSFVAFLGPNGAGKSTTIAMICALLRPDSGSISVFGNDSSSPFVKKDIGVVFQDPMLDKGLTVRENLEVRGSMYGLDDVDASVSRVMEASDCLEFADRPYGMLSGGQRRRADIARALVHSPRLLILDEPTSGLDPHTRSVIWNSIDRLHAGGMTVLLTTHYMEEASGADSVTVIDHGRIVAVGTPEELKERFSKDRLTIVSTDAEELESRLSSAGIAYSIDRGVFEIGLERTRDAIPVIDLVKDVIDSFEVRTGTLDEAFVAMTGGSE